MTLEEKQRLGKNHVERQQQYVWGKWNVAAPEVKI